MLCLFSINVVKSKRKKNISITYCWRKHLLKVLASQTDTKCKSKLDINQQTTFSFSLVKCLNSDNEFSV